MLDTKLSYTNFLTIQNQSKVYFIGAGPGDLGLLTLRAFILIQNADVIIYDALINTNVLYFAKPNSILIDAGKRFKCHKLSQNQINQLLIENAKKHKIVVRLKGGDPTIFARISEELDALIEANIEFEIVPGVTSAISAPTYAGIPLTNREITSEVAICTGHLQESLDINEISKSKQVQLSNNHTTIHWQALANINSIVILMGVNELSKIVKNLITHGKNPATPIAIIQNATTSYQKCIVGSLQNIVELSQKNNINPPAVIVVGDVVHQREKYFWFEKKPLIGKTFVITRAINQYQSLCSILEELGAQVINLPLIKIEKISNNKSFLTFLQNLKKNCNNCIAHPQNFEYIVFTSVNGVEIFFQELLSSELNLDVRNLYNYKFICIGPKTAQKLQTYGINADFTPQEFVSESLIPYFKNIPNQTTVYLFRAQNARNILQDELTKLGWKVYNIPIYYSTNNSDNIPEFAINKFLDCLYSNLITAVIFTSTSTVNNFVHLLSEKLKLDSTIIHNIPAISIGPITSKAVLEQKLKLVAQADTYTIEGILNKILEIYKK